MSRRNQVVMTDDEITAFLHEPHLCRIGTIGPKGDVHLVAMNYGFVDDRPAFWTYRSAQKTKNLERNPTLSLLVDTGVRYRELKGVSLSGTAELRSDPEAMAAFSHSLAERYGGPMGGTTGEAARASASKRVIVLLHATKTMSWDHAKLGGRY